MECLDIILQKEGPDKVIVIMLEDGEEIDLGILIHELKAASFGRVQSGRRIADLGGQFEKAIDDIPDAV